MSSLSEEAELRRQKILNQASDRLNQFEGATAPPPPSAAAVMEDNNTEEAEEGNNAAGTSTMSKVDRIKAMRRRRFKKGVSSPPPSKQAADSTSNDVSTNEASVPSTPVVAVDNSTTTETAEGVEKKKYKGVAAIRRQKLLEQREKEKAATAESDSAADERNGLHQNIEVPVQSADKKNLLLIAILFAVGFVFGLMSDIYYVGNSTQQQFAIGRYFLDDNDSNLLKLNTDDNESQTITTPQGATTSEEDEFSFETTNGDDDDDGVFDPLFGVNLRQLAKGDGLFFILARFAISIHEFFLSTIRKIGGMFYFMCIPYFCILSYVARSMIVPPIAKKNAPKGLLEKMAAGLFQKLAFLSSVRKTVYIMVFGYLLALCCRILSLKNSLASSSSDDGVSIGHAEEL